MVLARQVRALHYDFHAIDPDHLTSDREGIFRRVAWSGPRSVHAPAQRAGVAIDHRLDVAAEPEDPPQPAAPGYSDPYSPVLVTHVASPDAVRYRPDAPRSAVHRA